MMQKKSIDVAWAGETHRVWVAGAFDSYLDQFAEEVGGYLGDERCPFGVLLWPSARTLAQSLLDELRFPRNRQGLIVELGCGVGFLSCVLARIYPHAKILACDYESELQTFVDQNAETWGVSDRVQFKRIDWRQAPPKELQERCDWVLGTDVFYDDSHLTHLPPFAARLLVPGGRLTLADPQRYRYQKALSLLSEHFEKLGQREIPTSLKQDGIEDFMINAGLEEQMVSILEYKKRS
ncbi:MAG: class I SAM-dependent methyltransferase [Oligoflexus sp.]|jgi:predicted nicotinamide N-methyase